VVIDYYDQHGKRHWETPAEGTTETQANKRLREIQDKIDKGAPIIMGDSICQKQKHPEEELTYPLRC